MFVGSWVGYLCVMGRLFLLLVFFTLTFVLFFVLTFVITFVMVFIVEVVG